MADLTFITTGENGHFIKYWKRIQENMKIVANATKKVKDIDRLFNLVDEQLKRTDKDAL